MAGMFLALPVIAILKIIFDRIASPDALWGVLLGDEEGPRRPAAEKITGGCVAFRLSHQHNFLTNPTTSIPAARLPIREVVKPLEEKLRV
ncbi:MAG: hypothetical protein WKG07_39170 [Hymenobacter sp.]